MATQVQITKRSVLQTLVGAAMLGASSMPTAGWAAVRDEYHSANRAFLRVAKVTERVAWENLSIETRAANRIAGARLDAAYEAVLSHRVRDLAALREKSAIMLVESGEDAAQDAVSVLHNDIRRLA